MTVKLNTESFFKCFIHNPKSKHLSKVDRDTALLWSIFLNIITVGAISGICYLSFSYFSNRKVEFLKNEYTSIIKRTVSQEKPSELDRPSHKIINTLHLGNAKGWMKVSSLSCRVVNGHQMVNYPTKNPKEFKEVVSVCPVSEMISEFPDYNDQNTLTGDYAKNITEGNIRWVNIGNAIPDSPLGWDSLTHNCTFPKTELANRPLNRDTSTRDEWNSLFESRREIMAMIPTQKKFEPIFLEMDKAVFGENKTLVHCLMGKSRSATLVCAYLINRFKVTAPEAINFVKSKRPGIEPNKNFTAALNNYAAELNPAAKN